MGAPSDKPRVAKSLTGSKRPTPYIGPIERQRRRDEADEARVKQAAEMLARLKERKTP